MIAYYYSEYYAINCISRSNKKFQTANELHANMDAKEREYEKLTIHFETKRLFVHEK